MLKITSKKVTALIAVVLMITTLVITAIAAPVHTHEDISPYGVGNCCSNPCIEDYRVIHTKYSTHCVTTMQIPPRPDHLHGQNLPPRRTESAMLTEHYTTVVSKLPAGTFPPP